MAAADQFTPYPSQMAAKTIEGWGSRAIFTVGENVQKYLPVGILDGMYAWNLGELTGNPEEADIVRILVNHELSSSRGVPYALDNGTELKGARVSYFDLDKSTRGIKAANLAFNTIYNRKGDIVDELEDFFVEGGDDVNSAGGLNRLCSANGVSPGELGFQDAIFFTGEETGGGSEWALDVANGDLWAIPEMGRAAWESVAAIEPPDDNHVAKIIGDDRGGAPLLLYVGEKNAKGDGSFLDRNGLAKGRLYAWAPRFVKSPEDFNGTGNVVVGNFKRLNIRQRRLAGTDGWDEQGYATQDKQDELAFDVKGAFQFSRPEDVHTNPGDSRQVVMASTGRSSLFPSDAWGTTYLVEVIWQWNAKGKLRPVGVVEILYDGDDAGGQFDDPDEGIRSPDNLTWASDGNIYIQEDRSYGEFGVTSGEEASVWKLDPISGIVTRIAQIDRNVVAPVGVIDPQPEDIGNWESSGIIDVTQLFETSDGETLLMGNVQAHSLTDGVIGGSERLVQGGQLFFLNDWGGIEEATE